MIILLIITGFISNFLFFYLTWTSKEANILEYGYSITLHDVKKSKKELQKYSFLERIILLKLVKNSKKKVYPYFLLINHWLIIISMLISFIVLLMFLINKNELYLEMFYSIPFKVIMITVVIEFIPDIICVKSIRKRYKLF